MSSNIKTIRICILDNMMINQYNINIGDIPFLYTERIYMTIFYKLHDKLYVNITNACSCSCVFCIRKGGDGVGDADSLWLEREPSLDEIKEAFDKRDLDGVSEVVFCGYGEPLERADITVSVCEYIKSKCALPVRLNTNGLAELINPGFDISRLAVFDAVSISLNAADEDAYLKITRPKFGAGAYQAMLNFSLKVKKYTDVTFTAVDIIGQAQVEACVKIAESMGIPLRIRGFVGDNASYS